MFADADRDVAHGQSQWSVMVQRRLFSRLDHLERMGQRPNVVVREPERFDFRQLRVHRIRGQNAPETVQSFVQHVHPIPFPVVGLHAPVFFNFNQLERDLGEKGEI